MQHQPEQETEPPAANNQQHQAQPSKNFPLKFSLIGLLSLLAVVQSYRLVLAQLHDDGNGRQLDLGLLNQTTVSSPRLISPLKPQLDNQYPALRWYNCTIKSAASQATGARGIEDATNSDQKIKQEQQQHSSSIEAEDDVIGSMKRAALNEESLPAITSSYNPNRSEQLESCEYFFHKHDEVHQQFSVEEFALMALMAKTHSTVYNDIYTQKYDSYQEIKLASGPEVDQELCLKQLGDLNARARRQEVEKFHSKDVNLFQLLDTYGHFPSGLLIGNGFFIGMYNECVRMKIKLTAGESEQQQQQASVPTRYCVATFKHHNWPKIDKHDLINVKVGLCLPKTCDSLNYKNKYELIMGLFKYHMRRLDEDQFRVNFLYCLPDEDSPLRSIVRSSPTSFLTSVCLVSWILLLVYATWKYERERKKKNYLEARSFGMTSGFGGDHGQPVGAGCELEGQTMKIYRLLSIRNNLKNLFDTSKESAILEEGARKNNPEASKDDEKHELPATTTTTQTDKTSDEESKANNGQQVPTRKFIDLRCIEGIKVIAMAYVIMGHVLMCLTTLLNNGREMADTSSMAFYMANLVPAFAVNSFFTITGILTCYLMFKMGQSSKSFMNRPTNWLAFIAYRYLRIMPMYALVVLYTKTLAKFAGSGPLWDYGTSSLGQRRACEQESWSRIFLFGANFVPPLEHCIPSAWYLANDFQFFLVTPLFLMALNWRPKWGERLLIGCTLAGFLAGFLSIFLSDIDDVRPIAKFAPHAFKTYISHFSNSYTRPQYRCPAYLIGLLVGHKLFRYEQAKVQYHKSGDKRQPEPDWPDWFKRHAIHATLFLILVCCATPVIGARLPFNKSLAKFMVALITNSYHVLFSLAIGLYLMMATTGQGNKLLDRCLSAPFWKPLARLSLCAVLINVEVINYIVQSNTNMHYLTNQYQLAMDILCILCTYLVSIVVCVLFEAPIRGALNTLLGSIISKLTRKRKVE